MTLKDILENGYGIKFDSLKFELVEDADTCTKEEILESMANNEIVIDTRVLDEEAVDADIIDASDFDIQDDENITIFYLD